MQFKSKSIYINIDETEFFASMLSLPVSEKIMKEFINFHRGSKLLSQDKIINVCNFVGMSALQLDVVFVLARCMEHYYEYISSKMCECAHVHFNKIFNNIGPEYQLLFDNPGFYMELADHLMHDLDDSTSYDKFLSDFTKTFDFMLSYSKTFKDMDSMCKTALQNYLIHNPQRLQLYTKILYQEVGGEIRNMLPSGNRLLDLCSTPIVDDQARTELVNFIEHNHAMASNDLQNEETYKVYYFVLYDEHKDIYGYDPDLKKFWDKHMGGDTFYPSHTCYFNTPIDKNTANQKLLPHGYQIIETNTNSWMNTIVDCFVEYGFAQNRQEICMYIGCVLESERYTPGYTNKYDTTTLYDHYVLVSLANENSTSYDRSIQQIMGQSNIPYDYPIEILLRILSRIYNVNIVFITYNLTSIFVDNSIYDNPKQIAIYQYNPDSYCNIMPIESAQTTQQPTNHVYAPTTTKQLLNDVRDIQEI